MVVLDTASNGDVEEAIRGLKIAMPNTKIILLSNWDEKDLIRAGLSLGADGIVLKIQPPSVMRAAIEAYMGEARNPDWRHEAVNHRKEPTNPTHPRAVGRLNTAAERDRALAGSANN
jgi:DNA-binding NarL/FixJ family response regulator